MLRDVTGNMEPITVQVPILAGTFRPAGKQRRLTLKKTPRSCFFIHTDIILNDSYPSCLRFIIIKWQEKRSRKEKKENIVVPVTWQLTLSLPCSVGLQYYTRLDISQVFISNSKYKTFINFWIPRIKIVPFGQILDK